MRDAFITRLAPADGNIELSTYFGANGAEIIFDAVIEPSGNIVVAGATNSTNFPTTAGVISRTIAGVDCFITRLNPGVTQVVASTLFGGNQSDQCFNLERNAVGDLVVAGITAVTAAGATNSFPTTAGAFQRTYGGGAQDAFLARINSSLTQTAYSTLLGGSGDIDDPFFITIDPAGNIWTGGRTSSPNFPLTPGARHRTFRAPLTGWVTRLNTGSTAGPSLAGDQRAANFPTSNLSSYSPQGKVVNKIKIVDDGFVAYLVAAIQFELADGTSFSEIWDSDLELGDLWRLLASMDFIIEQIACSIACMEPPGSAPGNQAAADPPGAAPDSVIEFNVSRNRECTFLFGGRTYLGPNRLSLNQVKVVPLIPGTPPPNSALTLEKRGPDKVRVGRVIVYEVSVRNRGTVVARDVRVQDDLPPAAQLSSIRPFLPLGPSACTRNQNRIECRLGDIPPGQARTVFIDVTAPQTAGLIVNTARLGTLVRTHAVDVVRNSADLSVVKKRTGPFLVAIGALVNYTIRVRNNGPDAATNVQMIDATPPGAREITLTANRGLCNNVTRQCALPALAPGDSWEITLRLRLPGAEGVYKNTARVAANEADVNPANNKSSQDVRASRGAPSADIAAFLRQVALSPDGAQPVAQIAVTARNLGPGNVLQTRLNFTPPSFGQAKALSPTDGNCSPVGATKQLLCDLGALTAGQSKEVLFEVTTPSRRIDYFAEAAADAELPDPDLSNNRNQLEISTGAPPPTQRIDVVTNSARLSPQVLSPGSDPAVLGSGFAAELTTAPPGDTLPTELAGAELLLNDIPAPLFFVSPEQINFQVPWELLGETGVLLRVRRDGRDSYAQQVRVALFDPGIFTVDQSGSGQGSVRIAETDSLAAPEGFRPDSRPVKPGEFLLIDCNGLGPVDDPPLTGAATPADRPYETTEPVTVTIGGVEGRVVFAGLAPGSVGLYQVKVEVAEGTPAGDTVPLTLSVGGQTSNEVTIAVAVKEEAPAERDRGRN